MKTDSDLRLDVERELDYDPSVDAEHIGSAVRNGIVTLTGEVDSYVQKWHAARAVERVAGVRAVADDLQIRARDEHNDTDIAEAAANTVKWNALLPKDRVIVKVEEGCVTLTGELTEDYQRQAAERNVRCLRGVRQVINCITINPHFEAEDLRLKIEESFLRHAGLDPRHVLVQVDEGDVTLSGSVRSFAESRDAEHTAWAGPGVVSVTNRLTVGEPT